MGLRSQARVPGGDCALRATEPWGSCQQEPAGNKAARYSKFQRTVRFQAPLQCLLSYLNFKFPVLSWKRCLGRFPFSPGGRSRLYSALRPLQRLLGQAEPSLGGRSAVSSVL